MIIKTIKRPSTSEIFRKSEWHRWFAWRPITIIETGDIVWLQYVLRKGCWVDAWIYSGWVWKYKLEEKRKRK